jgi:hypothetical protein
VITGLTDRLDRRLPADVEQIFELVKSMQEEMGTHGAKMDANQENADDNLREMEGK